MGLTVVQNWAEHRKTYVLEEDPVWTLASYYHIGTSKFVYQVFNGRMGADFQYDHPVPEEELYDKVFLELQHLIERTEREEKEIQERMTK